MLLFVFDVQIFAQLLVFVLVFLIIDKLRTQPVDLVAQRLVLLRDLVGACCLRS